MAVSPPSCALDDKKPKIISTEQEPRLDTETKTTAPHTASKAMPSQETPVDVPSSPPSQQHPPPPSAGPNTTLALIHHPTPSPSSSPSPTPTAAQPPFTSPYLSAPITLLVGGPASPSRETEPVPFYVHADLLTRISPFFNAAFGCGRAGARAGAGAGANFKEAVERRMRLPEERPDDVRYLLQWVYARESAGGGSGGLETGVAGSMGGKGHAGLEHELIDAPLAQLVKHREERRVLALAGAEANGVIDELVVEKPKQMPAFGPLVRLWLLADKFDVMGGLREEVCERVRVVSEQGNVVPGREDVWALWEGCCVGGGGGGMGVDGEGEGDLKRVVLECFVGRRTGGMFVDGEGEGVMWHPAFLVDLVAVLMRELWKEGG